MGWWSDTPNENRFSWARTDVDPRLNQRETSADESSNSPTGESSTPSADTRTPQAPTSANNGRDGAEETPASESGSKETGAASENSAGNGKDGSAPPSASQEPTTNKNTASASAAQPAAASKPALRTPVPNPLKKFSSIAYKLTLYMASTAAYTYYNRTGKLPSEGVYVIASDGGVNASQKRPSSMPYDFYLDDLKFENIITSASSQNILKVSFNIIEPMGFSLTTQLYQASEKISKGNQTSTLDKDKKFSPLQQHYILSVQFLGYNSVGNLLNGSELSSTFAAAGNNSYQKFIPITITEFKFDLKASMVTYRVTGAVVNDVAKSMVKANIPSGSIEGTTVGEMLTSLEQKLNAYQKQLVDNKTSKIADKYKIVINDSSIKTAKVTSEDQSKTKAGAATGVTSPDKSNEAASSKNNSTKNGVRSIAIGETQMVSLIESVIQTSSYANDPLKLKQNENPETKQEENKSTQKANWFTVSTSSVPIGWDEVRNDWAYEFVYTINKMETPVVNSAQVGKDNAQPYRGPHKIYEYYFTGQNTEVLEYTQTYNNLYYVLALYAPDGTVAPQTGGSGKKMPSPVASGSTSSSKINNAAAPAAEVRKNILASAGDQIKVNLKIMGDPDYIVMDPHFVTSSASAINSAHVNASISQILVEIVFYEGTDYDVNTGVMKINRNLLFANYSDEVLKTTKGVVYKVVKSESFFSRGKFTQELTLIMATELWKGSDNKEQPRAEASANKTTDTAAKERTSQNTPAAKPTETVTPASQPTPSKETPNPRALSAAISEKWDAGIKTLTGILTSSRDD